MTRNKFPRLQKIAEIATTLVEKLYDTKKEDISRTRYTTKSLILPGYLTVGETTRINKDNKNEELSDRERFWRSIRSDFMFPVGVFQIPASIYAYGWLGWEAGQFLTNLVTQ